MRPGVIIGAALFAAWTCAFTTPSAIAQQADDAVVDTAAPVEAPLETPLTPEEAAILSNALTVDPGTLDAKPAKSLRLPDSAKGDQIDYSHSAKPDGGGTMAMTKPFAGDWDAKVGADVTLAPDQPGGYWADKPLPGIGGNQDSGAAWASVGMNNVASVDARVDPSSDQGRLGTTLKRSIPLGSKYSVTVQDTYAVTQSMGTSTTPAPIPLMTSPSGAATPPQVWSNQRSIKFDVALTGTTFGAGIATASNDPVTHNTFTADQKIYGPLHVTTAVTDLGETTSSKSLSAGLKLHW
jgi:hypothetical protein